MQFAVPTKKDPIARMLLVMLVVAVGWLAITMPAQHTDAAATMIVATPTLATGAATQPLAPRIDLATPTAKPDRPAAAEAAAAPTVVPPGYAEPTAPAQIAGNAAAEQAAQAERDRIAAEQAAQAERDRIAAEQAAQAQADADATARAIATANAWINKPTPAPAMTTDSGMIIFATPAPGEAGFPESFQEPSRADTCKFIGCLRP